MSLTYGLALVPPLAVWFPCCWCPSAAFTSCQLRLSPSSPLLLLPCALATSTEQDLSLGPLNCQPDPLYLPHTFRAEEFLQELPPGLIEACRPFVQQLPHQWFGPVEEWAFTAEPMVLHAMVLACFASLVAPFGERGGGLWMHLAVANGAEHFHTGVTE
jgi:hypothetical protein